MPAYKSYVIQVQVGEVWEVHHEGDGWMQELMTLLGPCTPKQGRANNLEMGEVFASNTVGAAAPRGSSEYLPPQAELPAVAHQPVRFTLRIRSRGYTRSLRVNPPISVVGSDRFYTDSFR